MRHIPELKDFARAVLVCADFIGEKSDLIAVVQCELKRAEQEARKRLRREEEEREAKFLLVLARERRRIREEIEREEEESELLELDKQFSSAPIREALIAIGC
jgi:hypothetical protein